MSEEYDLKKSEETMGQLLPVIKDAKGRIVDGLHRTKSNSAWRVEVRKEIETDEDYWKARAHLNYSRRNAQDAKEEKSKIIASLVKIYHEKGLSDSAAEIATIQALNGAMSKSYVQEVLHPIHKPYLDPTKHSALEALENDKVTVKARYGEDFVDRVKTEVKQELLKDPKFQREVIKEIRNSPLAMENTCPVPIGMPAEELERLPEAKENPLMVTCPHCKKRFEGSLLIWG